VTLPAFAAERRAAAPLLPRARRPPLSIDISCPRGAQQQTRRTPLLLSIDGTDGQTDGRTLDRYIDPAPYAGSVRCLYTVTQKFYILNGRLQNSISSFSAYPGQV